MELKSLQLIISDKWLTPIRFSCVSQSSAHGMRPSNRKTGEIEFPLVLKAPLALATVSCHHRKTTCAVKHALTGTFRSHAHE